MNHNCSDKIFIRDLLLRCVIGIEKWERKIRQDVLINITLCTALSGAGHSDDIDDTVNYKSLTDKIVSMTEDSKFYLVEALAEKIAAICLKEPRVKQVQVRVEKPGALSFSKSVGVIIERQQK